MYNKRKGALAVPSNLKQYLNELQLSELHKIESFGWNLLYLRRPLFQEPVAVVIHDDGQAMAVLEQDGSLNLESKLQIRL